MGGFQGCAQDAGEYLFNPWNQLFAGSFPGGPANFLFKPRFVNNAYEAPRGFSVQIAIKDPLDAERIFQALAESGTVGMPIRKPSGPPFLVCWSINPA